MRLAGSCVISFGTLIVGTLISMLLAIVIMVCIIIRKQEQAGAHACDRAPQGGRLITQRIHRFAPRTHFTLLVKEWGAQVVQKVRC